MASYQTLALTLTLTLTLAGDGELPRQHVQSLSELGSGFHSQVHVYPARLSLQDTGLRLGLMCTQDSCTVLYT